MPEGLPLPLLWALPSSDAGRSETRPHARLLQMVGEQLFVWGTAEESSFAVIVVACFSRNKGWQRNIKGELHLISHPPPCFRLGGEKKNLWSTTPRVTVPFGQPLTSWSLHPEAWCAWICLDLTAFSGWQKMCWLPKEQTNVPATLSLHSNTSLPIIH